MSNSLSMYPSQNWYQPTYYSQQYYVPESGQSGNSPHSDISEKRKSSPSFGFWDWCHQVLIQKCMVGKDWITSKFSDPIIPSLVHPVRQVYTDDVLQGWSHWISQQLTSSPTSPGKTRQDILSQLSNQLFTVYKIRITTHILETIYPMEMETLSSAGPKVGDFLSFTVPEADRFHHQVPFNVAHSLDLDYRVMQLKMNVVMTHILAPLTGRDYTWYLLEKRRSPSPPAKLPTPPVTVTLIDSTGSNSPVHSDLHSQSQSPSSNLEDQDYKYSKKPRQRDREGPRRKYSFNYRRRACDACHRKKRKCDHRLDETF